MSKKDPNLSGSVKSTDFTGQQKVKAALRLLQGENLDEVATDFGVSRERVSRWRDRFIEGGREAILRREDRDGKKSKRQKAILQWVVLIVVLLIVLVFLTRWLGSQGPAPAG